jgi:hypothetical protein
MAAPGVMKEAEAVAQKHLSEARHDPYDSHPPDAERIAALEKLPAGPELGDGPPAVSLLDGVEAIEPILLLGLLKPGLHLRMIGWNDAGMVAILPGLQARVKRQAALFNGYTVGWLPELLKYAERLGQAEARTAGQQLAGDKATAIGVGLAGSALATALFQNGWKAESLPGERVVLRRGDSVIDPFKEVNRLERREVDADTWQRRCWDLGIRDLSLVPLTAE